MIRIEKANAVADAINAAEPGRALAVVGDITDGNYITELVKQSAEFGGGKIHIIVNNAGFTWDGVIHKVRTTTTRSTMLSGVYALDRFLILSDDRQTMGHHASRPQHSSFPSHPRRSAILPSQRSRTPRGD